MSLKFLNLKSWHPSNKANQKKIWIAEQEVRQREESEKEAAKQVQKQQDLLRYKQIAAAKGDTATINDINAQTMSFMYAAPPGFQTKDAKNRKEDRRDGGPASAAASRNADDNRDDIVDGEDLAAREFKRSLKSRHVPTTTTAGTTSSRLERAVGRRAHENVTIAEQVERFPFLKDAPVEGDYASTLKVNFKPLGRQIRNVRCLRCQEWGHVSGDRDCRLNDQHHPRDVERQIREDPVTMMRQLKAENLVLNKSALPAQMTSTAAAQYELVLSSSDDGAENDARDDDDDDDDDHDSIESDRERRFVRSLTTREKKELLKQLKQGSRTTGRRSSTGTATTTTTTSSSSSSSSKRKKNKRNKRKTKRKHVEDGSSESDEQSSSSSRRRRTKSFKQHQHKKHKKHKRENNKSTSS